METSYAKGLTEVADGIHAYMQPDGGWGLSNAGLVTGSGESVLVDTLFDMALTREMLDQMKRAIPAAQRIGTLVNTHANGDHWWGNAAVDGAAVVASRACAQEMRELPPWRMALMVLGSRMMQATGPLARTGGRVFGAMGVTLLRDVVDATELVTHAFAPFRFGGIPTAYPTLTFEGAMTLHAGDTEVQLLEVGPAHTRGDVVAYVPAKGVLFTGDILFHQGHPVVWEGPVSSWIAALERLEALKPTVVVPGHGPLADVAALVRLREYLVHVDTEARKRHAAGMDAEQAAMDIALDGFAHWGDPERMAVNVEAVYRELDGRTGPVNVITMFARMARVARAMKRQGGPA